MPAITSILAAAAIAATAGSAISQADSARRATHAAQDAANRADPAADSRGFFQDWLMQHWPQMSSTDPNEITKNPNFQFLADEGGRGVLNDNLAKTGSLRNGTLLEDMSKFRTGLASNFIKDQFGMNMQALAAASGNAGFTTGSPAASGQIMMQGQQNANNQMNNFWQQVGGGLQLAGRTYGNVAAPPSPYPYADIPPGGYYPGG